MLAGLFQAHIQILVYRGAFTMVNLLYTNVLKRKECIYVLWNKRDLALLKQSVSFLKHEFRLEISCVCVPGWFSTVLLILSHLQRMHPEQRLISRAIKVYSVYGTHFGQWSLCVQDKTSQYEYTIKVSQYSFFCYYFRRLLTIANSWSSHLITHFSNRG